MYKRQILTGVNAGSQVFGQDPLWLAWATDLINLKDAGDMAGYQNLLATITPARFKVGQMIGATGLLLGIALAMYRRVDPDKRRNYRSMFISTVLAVFLTGVTAVSYTHLARTAWCDNRGSAYITLV